MGYRRGLGAALTTTALPYGYSLTVWSSGELVRHRHPSPGVGDILLFLLGAAVAYGALRLAAGTVETSDPGLGRRRVLRAGAIHAVAIGGAAGVALALAALPSPWAWLLGPLGATACYLALAAVEQTLEVREQERQSGSQ